MPSIEYHLLQQQVAHLSHCLAIERSRVQYQRARIQSVCYVLNRMLSDADTPARTRQLEAVIAVATSSTKHQKAGGA